MKDRETGTWKHREWCDLSLLIQKYFWGHTCPFQHSFDLSCIHGCFFFLYKREYISWLNTFDVVKETGSAAWCSNCLPSEQQDRGAIRELYCKMCTLAARASYDPQWEMEGFMEDPQNMKSGSKKNKQTNKNCTLSIANMESGSGNFMPDNFNEN